MNYSSITNISCLGSESRLSDCFIDNSGCVPTCNNNVGLRCYRSTGCQQGQVRLMDGVIQQQGRVEVCVDGVWSGICDDGWDKTNAYIVCQQLGFASTGIYYIPPYHHYIIHVCIYR
jgi:deleted-in-malignant-brain-tumors protein 1